MTQIFPVDLTFGEGTFREGVKAFKGQVVLSRYKLYLKGPQGEIPSTFVSVDRIESIRKSAGDTLCFFIRPTVVTSYRACLSAKKNEINDLIEELVKRFDFKKRFLRNEWVRSVKWNK